ncbi:MAG: transglutaminase-like domain-containing protein, partial [Spirochaetota bacterium]
EAFEVEIEIAADFYSSLPHSLDTGKLYFAEFPRIAEGSLDVGVVVDPPLLRGTRFSIRRAGGTAQSPELPEAAENVYLRIFDNTPEEIRRLAAMLARDNEAETIEAIRAYLRSNFAYSLDVPKPPKNQHFLAHFLFELERGYCVHFATAFTILCRLNGIPARYVTGYLVRLPWQSGTARVTGLQSHAWSEVWLKGRGWSTVEATPAIAAAAAGAPAESEYGGGFDARALDGLTARQLNALRGGGPGTAAPKAADRMLFTAAGLGALLLIVAILSFVRGQRSSRRKKAFFPRSVRTLLKVCEKAGIPPPEKIGWIEWKRKLQSTGADSRGHSEYFAKRVLVVLYRQNGISRRDKKYFRLAAARLRASVADRGSGRL